MVLNALNTLALAGAALATSCAIEVSSRVASPSALGIEGVADVDDGLAREGVSVLGDDRNDTVVQHGHDDDVPGRDGAPLSRRGAAAKSLGQVSGLGLIAAHNLDGVAARYRQRADGAGHVPGADDADAAHDACSLPLFSSFALSRLCIWARGQSRFYVHRSEYLTYRIARRSASYVHRSLPKWTMLKAWRSWRRAPRASAAAGARASASSARHSSCSATRASTAPAWTSSARRPRCRSARPTSTSPARTSSSPSTCAA